MALDFPANPTNGQIYGSYTYNSTVGAWQSREDSRTVAILSSTVPASANPGDIWVNTNDGISFVYYNDGTSSQWMELLPSGVPLLDTKADISGDTFTGNVTAPQFISNIATGTAPFGVTSTTSVTNLNADLLDGQHGSYYAPIASPTFTTNATSPKFTSTIATGTAPFTVTSTTAVTNLNADLLDGQHGSYYAPIASPSITGDLTVAGETYLNGTEISGDAKTIVRYSDAWLRLNPDNEFSSGIYAGTGILRTDGNFQVGASGSVLNVSSSTFNYNGKPASGLVPIIPTGGSYSSVSANGLVTFSAGVRVDGIFSADYDLYEIHLKINSASAADYLYYRYCTAGAADYTNAYYNSSMFSQSTTVAVWSNGNTSNTYSGRVGYFLNDGATYGVFKLHGPFGTGTKTMATFQSKYSATGNTSVYGSVGFNGTTSFDGILFNGESGSGTPNGTLQVFGYRK